MKKSELEGEIKAIEKKLSNPSLPASAKKALEKMSKSLKDDLKKLETTAKKDVKKVKKTVKKDVKKVEKVVKKVEKAVKDDVTALSDEELAKKLKALEVAVSRFKDSKSDIVKSTKDEIAKITAEIEKRATAKPKVEKKPVEAPAKKPPVAKAKKTPVDSAKNFTLTIDGEEYKFSDLESKESCAKAIEAVNARRKEQIKHKKATAEGKERAKTTSVTKRITDSFVSVAKKAVAEIPAAKINKNPTEIKKDIGAVENAFTNLFDKLESLMDKEIPASQRKQIMDVLTKFEKKVDKGASKKDVAVSKTRTKKADGGIISETGDSWSYASLM